MNFIAYVAQAPWALAAFVVCLAALVIGSALGIVVVARMTACSAADAAHALATVLTALRRKQPVSGGVPVAQAAPADDSVQPPTESRLKGVEF